MAFSYGMACNIMNMNNDEDKYEYEKNSKF